jgi:hypothetical protein
MRRLEIALIVIIQFAAPALAAPVSKEPANPVCAACIRAHEEFLASDAMNGRGTATHDELVAATYVASQLRQYGVEPAGESGGYIQTVQVDLTNETRVPPEFKRKFTTWNAVGILRGSDPRLRNEAILLSAHLDHLGVGMEMNGDRIYNGADDDASGVTAVLELARVLAAGPKPRRTIVFALFGAEEPGGLGARYFLTHLPVPFDQLTANLEFEMIGRPDAAVAPHTLWLTGYERSNLGPELARHGARLVADPHPEQKFFQRSDNYVLAKRGIVAHTVSSYGLHSDYHKPSDDLAHLDFAHMTDAIGSMLIPVRWLANSDFKPQWVEGKKP